MAVGLLPLRRRYMTFVYQPATTSWAEELITLEPGDVFETAAAQYTLLSETTDTTPNHAPDWTACFLKWTYSDPSGTPPDPAPAVASGDDTIVYGMNTFGTWATTQGTAFKTIGSVQAAEAQYLATQRATIWLCFTNTFGVTDPYNVWSVWGPAAILYRAPSERI